MMKIKIISTLVFLMFVGLSCTKKKQVLEIKKPNIIVILADDFGVGDIQAHYPNNKIPTPHLDKLVGEGMSFTDAHSSSAVCSPTRYSLLTGRYNWRTPLQEWVLASYEPPLIKDERTTLPEMLQQSNYATACIGKWHLGWYWEGERPSERIEKPHELSNYQWDYTKPVKGGPIAHGFDYYFGTHIPNFPPFTFIENDKIYIQPTDTYTNEAFEGLYMPKRWDNMPMAPDWKFEDILPELTNRAVKYIKEQANEEKPFFLYFSMTSPHEPVSPSANFQGKSGIAPIADFVMETDWSVGQVLNAVEEAGISENTIVIFTADNGHSHYTGWPELLEAGHKPSGPFRGHKGDIWEGGHRVPFIVKWKDKIQAASKADETVCLTDIYATLQELTQDKELPANEGEDSFSFLPTLMNKETKAKRENLVSHSRNGEFAFRKGDWKLVYKLPKKGLRKSRGKAAIAELYNLKEDIAEANNVIQGFPEVAQELKQEFDLIVSRGTSKDGEKQRNDVLVRADTIQMVRWARK